jgi:hypothetical protein
VPHICRSQPMWVPRLSTQPGLVTALVPHICRSQQMWVPRLSTQTGLVTASVPHICRSQQMWVPRPSTQPGLVTASVPHICRSQQMWVPRNQAALHGVAVYITQFIHETRVRADVVVVVSFLPQRPMVSLPTPHGTSRHCNLQRLNGLGEHRLVRLRNK